MFLKDYNKTALIHNDENISYAGLLASVRKFAALLKIEKGDRVIIFSENRPEWVYSFFAIWNKKGITVPVDFLSTQSEVAYIINDCRPAVVFTSNNNLPMLNKALELVDYNPQIILYDKISLESEEKDNLEPDDKDDIAVIIYTSGTTGDPKGVMLTYGNLYSNVECITSLDVIGYNDRMIAILPFHHAFPLQGTILMPLYIGGTLVFLNQLSSEEILKTLQKHKITIDRKSVV